MSKIQIYKPNKRSIRGNVSLSGAKNSALKVLTASVLAQGEVVLDNIPLDIEDVKIKLEMLRGIGARIEEDRPGRVRISWPDTGPEVEVPGEFGSIRTSLLFLGALLSRKGKASIPLPGGCKIGGRKHDLHLMALRKYGAECRENDFRIHAQAERLKGTEIRFPLRTTGGTENAILAGVLAEGKTRIYNAHTRPEVLDLIQFLNSLGAKVQVPGSGLIEIQGVEKLSGGYYEVIYDNLEAMTFAAYAAITGSRISIRHFPARDLEIPLIYLRESGVQFQQKGDRMIISRPGILAPFDLSTGTYPGVNSDMQPLFTVLATQAEGESKITDIRFRDRFQYVSELKTMGAEIKRKGSTVTIKGPTPLQGTTVQATDLRGGAALTAAALVAEGETTIEQAEQIDRGYENFDQKISRLGVNLKRVQD